MISSKALFKVITRQNGINYTQSLAQSAYFTALDELAAYENQNDSMLTALKVSNPDPALSIYLDMRTLNTYKVYQQSFKGTSVYQDKKIILKSIP